MSKQPLFAAIAVLLCAVSPASAQQAQADFPDGPGKQTFVNFCGGYHDINRSRAGYTPEGWQTVMRMMLNFDVPVPKDEVETLTQYLIKNFPERPRTAAVVMPGPVEATIKLWPVPTPGSRPHDPLATRDGAIWYTGQLSGKLGRVDPKTGAIKEYPLKTPHTAPHGLVEDKDGNIWFTGNHLSLIGNLDPKTGDIKLVTSPTPNSRPYGLLINSKGIPVLVEFGTNKIATVDPNTMAIKEYALPNAASRPRRLALGPDDAVWYADFSRGYLGRLNLATGEHKEWPSPSGPKSEPYGIVFTKGALWYNESGAKPNTIVRFDPKTEKFQSWAIPGGGDIVRNMSVTPDGNPVTANSLVNQVGLVEVK